MDKENGLHTYAGNSVINLKLSYNKEYLKSKLLKDDMFRKKISATRICGIGKVKIIGKEFLWKTQCNQL